LRRLRYNPTAKIRRSKKKKIPSAIPIHTPTPYFFLFRLGTGVTGKGVGLPLFDGGLITLDVGAVVGTGPGVNAGITVGVVLSIAVVLPGLGVVGSMVMESELGIGIILSGGEAAVGVGSSIGGVSMKLEVGIIVGGSGIVSVGAEGSVAGRSVTAGGSVTGGSVTGGCDVEILRFSVEGSVGEGCSGEVVGVSSGISIITMGSSGVWGGIDI
jgi:hypothetical protein